MADTHEEQLLSDLLNEIAGEDARLDASHLEARVLDAVANDSRTAPSRWRVRVALAAAAALMLALATTLVPRKREPAQAAALPSTRETTVVIDRTPPATAPQPPPQVLNAPAVRTVRRAAAPKTPAQPESHQVPAAETRMEDSAIEFVPLLPMSEQELAGSFQIVRVQMPNASLGALRSPLRSSNDLVEADVLLGEDGRARAIRLNTNGSIFPWRSR
jgi:hypothetical protein